MINLKGKHRKNKHNSNHPDVSSAMRSISHSSDLPVYEPDGNMEYSSDFKNILLNTHNKYCSKLCMLCNYQQPKS